MTTTTQNTALESPVVRVAYFAEFHFTSGILYLSTLGNNVTWGGHEWIGLGSFGGISAINESEGLESSALTFTLNAAQPSWIALAIGPVEEYRGLSAKMYMCPLDNGFQLIDTPEICWRGIMDTMSFGLDGDQGKIQLKCETSAYGMKRQPQFRLNAAQHKKTYPTDTGLDYLVDIIAQPQLWVSKRFQEQ